MKFLKNYFLARIPTNQKPNSHEFIRENLCVIRVDSCQKGFFRALKKGQSTLEYAVIIAIVIAALISMMVYVKRGLCGRLRGVADELGQQYEPGYTIGEITTTLNKDTETETKSEGGFFVNEDGIHISPRVQMLIQEERIKNETTNRSGTEEVEPPDKNYEFFKSWK